MFKKKEKIHDFEEIVIELKDRMVTLQILPFDTDIDVDDMLKIDYTQVYAEILTFTVLYNRIGTLKAELENIVAHSKFDIEVLEAQLFSEKKKQLIKDGEKGTEAAIDALVKTDAVYIAKKKMHFDKIKNLSYLDSLYWASQAKVGLLRSLSDKLRPEEFLGELLTDTINGVMIKASKKLIN